MNTDIIQMHELYKYAYCIALIGYVYSSILTEPDMIFHGLYKFLEKWLSPIILKPLIGCFRCVCGQIALWFYIIQFKYSFVEHVYFISVTIFFSIIIDKIYRTCRS